MPEDLGDAASQSAVAELAVRAQIIQEAINYSRQFRGRWFVVHVASEVTDVSGFSQDLQLLRSLGMHVAVVCSEGSRSAGARLAEEIRTRINYDDISAVVLGWEETRAGQADRFRGPRWLEIGEAASVMVLVSSPNQEGLRNACTLAVESSAAKLILLERAWDPSLLPVGGPGSPRPTPEMVRPHLGNIGEGAATLAVAVDAVERGVDEAHIVPTSENLHPILVEIFTDEGIGTWLGP
jgi:hypothetical protein